MAMNNLGRVAMIHRGDYDPGYDYKPLDCCYHQGSTYICKAETVGNAPPNAAYWVLMSTSASTVDRDAAEAAALEAQGYKDQAAAQVGLAADQVALAAGHVDAAAGHVTAAQGKVDLAEAQVALAEGHAVDAGTSAVAALASEQAAAGSASAAEESATASEASAVRAEVAAGSTEGKLPPGGSVGQSLVKISAADFEVGWAGIGNRNIL
ncbi:MAG: hypothetical protein GX650_05755, partial [Clostridiales bacterium]|nr:hypothetical protein [Clostridiales bacterium]